MAHEIELLTEIRDLLQVMAETGLAKRDEKFRAGVRLVAGNSQKKCCCNHADGRIARRSSQPS